MLIHVGISIAGGFGVFFGYRFLIFAPLLTLKNTLCQDLVHVLLRESRGSSWAKMLSCS